MMKEKQSMMKEHQAMMIDQQASLRNHQASIHNLEAQLGQLTTLENEKLSPRFPEKKTQSHVMMIETEEEAISEFLEALEVDPRHPEPEPKKLKIENQNSAEILNSRHEPS